MSCQKNLVGVVVGKTQERSIAYHSDDVLLQCSLVLEFAHRHLGAQCSQFFVILHCLFRPEGYTNKPADILPLWF
jgi:hypothetical protein